MARRGFPETVYSEWKTVEELKQTLSQALSGVLPILFTRLNQQKAQALMEDYPDQELTYFSRGQILRVGSAPEADPDKKVAVITAGTSDAAVAEECRVTLQTSGITVVQAHDVGVAGVHRTLAAWPTLEVADVLIVIAGMDGALPSLIAGLARRPVIAVPTSVGYGAAFSGVAPLLTMLNSCAEGIAVVNIDNGFGAARMALTILSLKSANERT